MAHELPYLPSYKNVSVLFDSISTAKVPESFTQKFLIETIGLKASGDRSLINLLKQLGFLDGNGKPTQRYAALKNDRIAGIEIARGIKEAYQPLFDANEKANELEHNALKGLVGQVSGADTGTTSKIVGTFKALLKKADFESEKILDEEKDNKQDLNDNSELPPVIDPRDTATKGGMRPEFHYNFQIHLPSNGTEETYMHIFNAMRKVFK